MWIWKFFRQIFSYFWKNWDISNHVCNHFLCREGDESYCWCNFTKKNIRHEPKTVYRALVKHFSQKNFKGPQTPHFADTDLSRLSKKTFFHILVCQNFEFWRLKGICRKTKVAITHKYAHTSGTLQAHIKHTYVIALQ